MSWCSPPRSQLRRAEGSSSGESPSCRAVAGCSSGRRCCHEEPLAESSPDVVPLADVVSRRRDVGLRGERGLLVGSEPADELLEAHLGVELDAPGGVAEAERLRTDLVASELHRSGWYAGGVFVPL